MHICTRYPNYFCKVKKKITKWFYVKFLNLLFLKFYSFLSYKIGKVPTHVHTYLDKIRFLINFLTIRKFPSCSIILTTILTRTDLFRWKFVLNFLIYQGSNAKNIFSKRLSIIRILKRMNKGSQNSATPLISRKMNDFKIFVVVKTDYKSVELFFIIKSYSLTFNLH